MSQVVDTDELITDADLEASNHPNDKPIRQKEANQVLSDMAGNSTLPGSVCSDCKGLLISCAFPLKRDHTLTGLSAREKNQLKRKMKQEKAAGKGARGAAALEPAAKRAKAQLDEATAQVHRCLVIMLPHALACYGTILLRAGQCMWPFRTVCRQSCMTQCMPRGGNLPGQVSSSHTCKPMYAAEPCTSHHSSFSCFCDRLAAAARHRLLRRRRRRLSSGKPFCRGRGPSSSCAASAALTCWTLSGRHGTALPLLLGRCCAPMPLLLACMSPPVPSPQVLLRCGNAGSLPRHMHRSGFCLCASPRAAIQHAPAVCN